MPIIPAATSQSAFVRFSGAASLAANGEIRNHLHATLISTASLTATLTGLINADAQLIGGAEFEGTIFNVVEANKLGAAALSGSSSFIAAGQRKKSATAILSGGAELRFEPSNIQAEIAEIPVFYQIIPAVNSQANIQIVGARLMAKGEEVPIRSFRFSTSTETLGKTLSIELSRPFPTESPVGTELSFDIFAGGTWINLLSGIFGSRQFSVEFAANRLNISTVDSLTDQLTKAPSRPTVIYNPALTEIPRENPADVLRDTLGNKFPMIFVSMPNLKLYDLFDYVFKTVAGFQTWKTNIPNFTVISGEFPIGRPAIDAVKSLIGFLEPVIYERNGTIFIWEVTSPLPTGFPARLLTASRFRSFESATGTDAGNLDGLILTFTETLGDFHTQRFETEEQTTEDQRFGIATITITREFRDYKNIDDPLTVVRSILKSETKTTKDAASQTIGEETTEYNINSRGIVVGHEKTISSMVPAGIETGDQLTFAKVSETRQDIEFSTDSSGRQFMSGRTTRERSLVAFDDENQYLGQTFRQDFLEAHQAGNLRTGMQVSELPTKTTYESFQRLVNGQTTVTTTVIDHLRGGLTRSRTEAENGEVAINQRRKQRQLIIWRDGFVPNGIDLSQRRLRELNGGEMPLALLRKYAQRRLARDFSGKGTASAELFGFDPTIALGSTFTLSDQFDNGLGNFVTVGFEVSGENLGTDAPSILTRLSLIEL